MDPDRPQQGATDTDDGPALPPVVEYLIAAFLMIVGVAFALGGALILFVVDQKLIADVVAEESFDPSGMTQAQLVELGSSSVTWLAIGLLVAGGLLAVVAIAYAVVRYRKRTKAPQGTNEYDSAGFAGDRDGQTDEAQQLDQFWTIALLGGIVSAVASFVPFSQVLGGGVAGYLESDQSGRVITVGALAGFLPLVPMIGIGAFALFGVAQGALAIGKGELAVSVSLAGLFAMLLGTALSTGLGAIGGYAGDWIADDQGV